MQCCYSFEGWRQLPLIAVVVAKFEPLLMVKRTFRALTVRYLLVLYEQDSQALVLPRICCRLRLVLVLRNRGKTIRDQLMYYHCCWRLSKGRIDPKDVNKSGRSAVLVDYRSIARRRREFLFVIMVQISSDGFGSDIDGWKFTYLSF